MKRNFLVLTAIVPIIALIIIPIIHLGFLSFGDMTNMLEEPYVKHSILITFNICILTLIITHIIGVPLGIYLSRMKSKLKTTLVYIMLFSTLTSGIVRTISWIAILSKDGVINSTLLNVHLINESLPLLYNNFSIVIGMVYIFLPLTVINIFTACNKIDEDVIHAARMLGANSKEVLKKVIYPQLFPDMIISALLVFTASFSIYSIPKILGSSEKVLATLLQDYAVKLSDNQSAGAIALLMIIISIVIVLLFQLLNKRSRWL